MAKALSMDLRARALKRLTAGESVRAVAAALSISASSVVKWSQRFRATGSAAPGKMGGHRKPLLTGLHRQWLLERMARADFTLRGLVAELAAERGLKVDYKTMWVFAHAEHLSFKKKRAGIRAEPRRRGASTRAVEAAPAQH